MSIPALLSYPDQGIRYSVSDKDGGRAVAYLLALMLSLPSQEPASPAPVVPEQTSPPTGNSPRTTNGQRIKEPKKTKHVSPEWPTNALRAGLTGSVILECVLGVDGRVETVKVLKG